MSYRLTVLQELTDHLKQITPTNGYDFDLSQSVFRGRTTFDDNDPIPMLSILEAESDRPPIYTNGNNARYEDWGIVVQGWVEDDNDNPSDPAYLLAQAVEDQLFRLNKLGRNGNPEFPTEYRLGGIISDITIGPPRVVPSDAGMSTRTAFYLHLAIKLRKQ